MSFKKKACVFLAAAILFALLPAFGMPAKAANAIVINEANFPDPVVRSYVSSKIDTSKNGILEEEEIAAATMININNRDLTSLKGIEIFTSLERLYCSGNMDICSLDSVDLSSLTALKYVEINATSITSLDLSGHSALLSLNISQNSSLTSVNLSGCYCPLQQKRRIPGI